MFHFKIRIYFILSNLIFESVVISKVQALIRDSLSHRIPDNKNPGSQNVNDVFSADYFIDRVCLPELKKQSMKLITDRNYWRLGVFARERVMAVKLMLTSLQRGLLGCNLQEVRNQKVDLGSQRWRSLQMHGGSSSTVQSTSSWSTYDLSDWPSTPPKGSSSRPGSRVGLLTGRTIVFLTGFLLNSTWLGPYRTSGSLGHSAPSTIIRCSRSGWRRVFRPRGIGAKKTKKQNPKPFKMDSCESFVLNIKSNLLDSPRPPFFTRCAQMVPI